MSNHSPRRRECLVKVRVVKPKRPAARILQHDPIRGNLLDVAKAVEKAKASMRALVEHPFHILKNIFRQRKVRGRGLAKNGPQRYTLFGLAKVVIGGRAATT